MRIPCADELVETSIAWLWPGRLALGKLSALDGHPGVGKSWLALDLCARFCAGRPLPDGRSPRAAPAHCLVLTSEETGADVRGRLRLLAADLKRVFVFSALDPGMDIEDLRWPARRDTWDQILGDLHPILTVVDPIFAFLSSHAVSSEIRLRTALLPLQCLAERHRTCLLLIRHLAKVGSGPAITRGLGPIGLSGVCRSTWLVAPDPIAPTQRQVFAQIKNNLAAPQPSLAFSLQESGASDQESSIGSQGACDTQPIPDSCSLTPAPCPLVWHGPTDWTAEQLLGQRLPKLDALSPGERARELLIELLSGGPRSYTEIMATALKRGISERTVKRIRDEMELKHCRVVTDGRQSTFWHLDSDAPPANVVQSEGAAILEPYLRPLRERFQSKALLEDE